MAFSPWKREARGRECSPDQGEIPCVKVKLTNQDVALNNTISYSAMAARHAPRRTKPVQGDALNAQSPHSADQPTRSNSSVGQVAPTTCTSQKNSTNVYDPAQGNNVEAHIPSSAALVVDPEQVIINMQSSLPTTKPKKTPPITQTLKLNQQNQSSQLLKYDNLNRSHRRSLLVSYSNGSSQAAASISQEARDAIATVLQNVAQHHNKSKDQVNKDDVMSYLEASGAVIAPSAKATANDQILSRYQRKPQGEAQGFKNEDDVKAYLEECKKALNPLKPGTEWWKEDIKSRSVPFPAAPPAPSLPTPDTPPLYVAHITAEMADIAKVGGLADVVTGLSQELVARGHRVEVHLPHYSSIDMSQLANVREEFILGCPKGSKFDGEMTVSDTTVVVSSALYRGVRVLLYAVPGTNLFVGGGVYAGGYDEKEAYLFFSRAVLEYFRQTSNTPDVLHTHEWQTAAVGMIYWELYAQQITGCRVMLTIHNTENTGEVSQEEFYYAGMPGEQFADIDKALDERTLGHNPERLSTLKGGIVYANSVTTVSPTFAQEVLSGGGFLTDTLKKHKNKFAGVVNGIDYDVWDPAYDPLLPANYTTGAMAGKAMCRQVLQEALGMNYNPDQPLVAVVSRIVPQKAPDKLECAAYLAQELGFQYVLLGSGYQDNGLKHLAAHDFNNNPNVRLLITYSDALAHLIYGAADAVLMPSNFEPCGLTQLIAMRYGAVPLVRRTGGLADTVQEVEGGSGTGFLFDGQDMEGFKQCIKRLVDMYKGDKEGWKALVDRGMTQNSSWETSTQVYLDKYRKMLSY